MNHLPHRVFPNVSNVYLFPAFMCETKRRLHPLHSGIVGVDAARNRTLLDAVLLFDG